MRGGGSRSRARGSGRPERRRAPRLAGMAKLSRGALSPTDLDLVATRTACRSRSASRAWNSRLERFAPAPLSSFLRIQ